MPCLALVSPLRNTVFFFIHLGSKVRLVTLELAVVVLKQLAVNAGKSRLKDFHYAMIEVGQLAV